MSSDESGLTPGTVATVVRAVRAAVPALRAPSDPVRLDPRTRWMPALVDIEGRRLVHALAADSIPGHVVRRLKAARDGGWEPYLALSADLLLRRELLDELLDADVALFVVSYAGGGPQATLHDTVAGAVASIELAVRHPATRARAGHQALSRCETADTNAKKGRTLEDLVAFLVVQTSELRVFARDLRTETEELDVIAQQATSGTDRGWEMHAGVFLVFEAKNWSARVPQPTISSVAGKSVASIARKELVYCWLVVSLSGFTSAATLQAIRLRAAGNRIVLLDRENLVSLINAPDVAARLDELISKRLLDA